MCPLLLDLSVALRCPTNQIAMHMNTIKLIQFFCFYKYELNKKCGMFVAQGATFIIIIVRAMCVVISNRTMCDIRKTLTVKHPPL